MATSFAAIGARLRWHLNRRRWIVWLIISALAATAGLGVLAAGRRYDEARARWGQPVAVWVARRPVEPGEALAGAVEQRELPAPIVPAGALDTAAFDGPADLVARQRIGAGEVIVRHDVTATSGALALMPDDWRAVAIALAASQRPPLQPGDVVGVVTGALALADGIVVAVDDQRVVVALPPGSAAEAAGAALSGDATVTLANTPAP